jgi:membrane protease YdiL (CAAX protease family)
MIEIYLSVRFPILFCLAIIIFGPFFEEVLFRGFVFRGIEFSKLGTTGALCFSALFWAALHVQYDLFRMLYVLALGFLLGAARLKTGSTYLTLSLHCLNNFASTLQILIHLHLSA